MKKIIFSSPLKVRVRSRKSGILILFCIVLFTGIAFGAISGRNADGDMMKRLDFIFQTNYHVRCSQGFVSAFVSSFGSSVIFLGVIFLLGLSVWGGFFAWAVPFLKGYGYGLSAGYLYGIYGFYGVGYNLLVVLPGAFLSALVIAGASMEAVGNSLKIAGLFTRSEVRDDPHIQMKKYLKTMLLLLCLCAVSAVLDVIFAVCFSWIFKF